MKNTARQFTSPKILWAGIIPLVTAIVSLIGVLIINSNHLASETSQTWHNVIETTAITNMIACAVTILFFKHIQNTSKEN